MRSDVAPTRGRIVRSIASPTCRGYFVSDALCHRLSSECEPRITSMHLPGVIKVMVALKFPCYRSEAGCILPGVVGGKVAPGIYRRGGPVTDTS